MLPNPVRREPATLSIMEDLSQPVRVMCSGCQANVVMDAREAGVRRREPER